MSEHSIENSILGTHTLMKVHKTEQITPFRIEGKRQEKEFGEENVNEQTEKESKEKVNEPISISTHHLR
jgi:hypothetical protein